MALAVRASPIFNARGASAVKAAVRGIAREANDAVRYVNGAETAPDGDLVIVVDCAASFTLTLNSDPGQHERKTVILQSVGASQALTVADGGPLSEALDTVGDWITLQWDETDTAWYVVEDGRGAYISSGLIFDADLLPEDDDTYDLGSSTKRVKEGWFSDKVEVDGRILCDDATDATTTLDGSIQTDGGLSVAKAAVIGGRLLVDDTTDATSTTDGSLQTDGGLSVAKAAVIGTSLALAGAIETDAHANMDDLIVGDKTVNNNGVAIMASDRGRLGVSDNNTQKGYFQYDISSAEWQCYTGGSESFRFNSTQLEVQATTDATSTTDGSLQTDGGLSVAKAAVIGTSLALAGAIEADAHADADDLIVGDMDVDATHGMSVMAGSTSGVSVIHFGTNGKTNAGQLRYTHSTDRWAIYADQTHVVGCVSNGFEPSGDNTIKLGTGSLRWSQIHGMLGRWSTDCSPAADGGATLGTASLGWGVAYFSGNMHASGLKSGANQGAAGAAANELWVDTGDQTIKLGT